MNAGDQAQQPTIAQINETRATAAIEIGGPLLDEILRTLRRFVVYPNLHAAVAHALWCVHAHCLQACESTPRFAFLSPEPGSGKTRALEITQLLVPRPMNAINATPSYLFRKVSDESGPPTILFDEIDALFGPRAKEHEDVRSFLNAGHRRGAHFFRCAIRGATVVLEEFPAYCAVALAGLGSLPDTILSRSIVVRMQRRAPGEVISPYRRRYHESMGLALRDRIAEWAVIIMPLIAAADPAMPESVTDRDADVWESLLAVADVAGGEWPNRAREAAVAFVKESKLTSPSLGIRLLADLHGIFGQCSQYSTKELLDELHRLDEAPWAEYRKNGLTSRSIGDLLRPYGIRSRNLRFGTSVCKGFARHFFEDAWARYLPSAASVSGKSATAATSSSAGETGEPSRDSINKNVGDVADRAARADGVFATSDSIAPANQAVENRADVGETDVAGVADFSEADLEPAVNIEDSWFNDVLFPDSR